MIDDILELVGFKMCFRKLQKVNWIPESHPTPLGLSKFWYGSNEFFELVNLNLQSAFLIKLI